MCSNLDGSLHRPVLYQEIIHALRPEQGSRFVDCTLGAGGHASGILEHSSPNGKLLGFEIDPQALELAQERLAVFGSRAILVQNSYVSLKSQLQSLDWQTVDGILLDLGVSSMQVDTPHRGFSFLHDAPLDMRFSPQSSVTAADLVNDLPEAELADLIFQYGEEHYSRQIAKAIVRERPIQRTVHLANIISGVVNRQKRYSGKGTLKNDRIHPATRTFQALRIEVNHELEALETVLPVAVEVLAPQGRLAVISFHSLEDRIVKQYFRRESQDCICPPRQPICTCGHRATIKEVFRKPVRPQTEETEMNPRSRSARLRVAERLSE